MCVVHCRTFYKMSLLFSIYLAVHYFGRNFCDIVHTANQLLHSANLQIFRSVPPCMHHIKFSKKYMMWYVYPLRTLLGGEFSPPLQKISLIFILILVLKAVRFLKEFWNLSNRLTLTFNWLLMLLLHALLFLKVWLIFYHPDLKL